MMQTKSLGRWPLLLLASAAAFTVTNCSTDQASADGGGMKFPPMPVEVAEVAKSGMVDRFEAVGNIDAVDRITVVSEVDAIVKSLPFHEGVAVSAGDVIAQLDDEQLQAQKVSAEAVLSQRKLNYERIKSIVEQKAGAPQALDDAQAAYRVAEADLAVVEARLKKTRITAPFSGVLGTRRVSPGAFLRAGSEITDLSRLSELKVTFAAPERYLTSLRRGANVVVTTPALPDTKLEGTIAVVEPVVDSITRSVRLTAHVDNPEQMLRPGMSANVSAVLDERTDALVVPDEAVFVEGDQSLVFVVKDDSTVARTPIRTGTRTAQLVEVVSGLSVGQKVVRAGHQKLFEGAKVMPMSAEQMQGQAQPSAPMGAR